MSLSTINPLYLEGWTRGASKGKAPEPTDHETLRRGYLDGVAARESAIAVEELREAAESRFARIRTDVTPERALEVAKAIRDRGLGNRGTE